MLGPPEPCGPWTTKDTLCCDTSCFTAVQVDQALVASTQYLYDRTCRRWPGLCTATIRPCAPCSCRRAQCECRYTTYELPSPYPITQVLAVKVDGVALAPGDTRRDGNRLLVLQDPNSLDLHCFPSQDLDLVDDAIGTWSVQYEWGAMPIELAKLAAGDLACQLLKACDPDTCDLPNNVSSVTRQGVTIRFFDPSLKLTNVARADLLINTYKCKHTTRFVDPDSPVYAYRGT